VQTNRRKKTLYCDSLNGYKMMGRNHVRADREAKETRKINHRRVMAPIYGGLSVRKKVSFG